MRKFSVAASLVTVASGLNLHGSQKPQPQNPQAAESGELAVAERQISTASDDSTRAAFKKPANRGSSPITAEADAADVPRVCFASISLLNHYKCFSKFVLFSRF
jgi:hypothetical protein